jgi:hypothetical protein
MLQRIMFPPSLFIEQVLNVVYKLFNDTVSNSEVILCQKDYRILLYSSGRWGGGLFQNISLFA